MDYLSKDIVIIIFKYDPKSCKLLNKKFYSCSTKLNIFKNGITSKILNSFPYSKIYSLNLNSNIYINNEDLKKLSNLTCLSLSCNNKITDEGIKDLSNLKRLSLFQNDKISGNAIKDLNNLKYLDYRGFNGNNNNLLDNKVANKLKKNNCKIILYDLNKRTVIY